MSRSSFLERALWGVVATLVFAVVTGCGGGDSGNLIGNDRPQVALTARPQGGDSVYYAYRMQWSAYDPDGRVSSFVYAIDPPVMGDTVWTPIERYEVTLFFKSSGPDSTAITPNPTFPATEV